jgi:hypothetical protein
MSKPGAMVGPIEGCGTLFHPHQARRAKADLGPWGRKGTKMQRGESSVVSLPPRSNV